MTFRNDLRFVVLIALACVWATCLRAGEFESVTVFQNGKAKGTRGGAYSSDGGESFDRSTDSSFAYFQPAPDELDPPVVQSSLLRAASHADGDENNLILFSGPDENGPTGKGRSDLRIRYSTDETNTWRDGPLIHEGPAAYSDMVRLGAGRYGVLFESGRMGNQRHDQIVFVTITDKQVIGKPPMSEKR